MQSNDTIISSRVALPTPVLSGNLGMTKDKVDETSGQGDYTTAKGVHCRAARCSLAVTSRGTARPAPPATLAVGQQLLSMLGMMCTSSSCLRLPEGIALPRV